MKYWLFKSEPEAFSYQDLQSKEEAFWDGVRNYQARNYLRDLIQVGDQVLFYHSNANPSGIAGLAEVLKTGAPDPTQFDPNSKYFDPKADLDSPRWYGVTIKPVLLFKRFLVLTDLKKDLNLSSMVLIQKGSRLSVQPVEEKHFQYIFQLGTS